MCLAVPAQIKRIVDDMADVDLGGVSLSVGLAMTPDAQVGDYVIVHAGYAISVLDEEEALETLRLFEELNEAEGDLTTGMRE
jgi:hydrogenase expression/formation protein HypC